MLTSYIASNGSVQGCRRHGWILAIDTSTEVASLALTHGDQSHLVSWNSGRRQSTEVQPRIQQLMDMTSISAIELEGVAVALGPGSFTGLRVGLSLAKGFALGAEIPVMGVPTLDAIALPWLLAGVSVVAVLPAGRGRVVWQVFSSDEKKRAGPAAPVNTTVTELSTHIAESGVRAIVGELTAELREQLAVPGVSVATDAGLVPRVGAIASLGRHRLESGDVNDVASLEPIYIHGHTNTASTD